MSTPTSASGRTLWCGPYAIAVIFGTDYDTAYKKTLRSVNKRLMKRSRWAWKKTRIQGLGNMAMERVIRTRYKKFIFANVERKPTLKNYLDHLRPNRLYVVNVTGHYVLINTKDWTISDNQLGQWVPVNETTHYMRSRVVTVALVKKFRDVAA
jgi:hypothetical protein